MRRDQQLGTVRDGSLHPDEPGGEGGGGKEGGGGYIQYTSIFRPAEVVMVPAILRWQLGGWDFGKIMVRSQEHSCSCYIPCT